MFATEEVTNGIVYMTEFLGTLNPSTNFQSLIETLHKCRRLRNELENIRKREKVTLYGS